MIASHRSLGRMIPVSLRRPRRLLKSFSSHMRAIMIAETDIWSSGAVVLAAVLIFVFWEGVTWVSQKVKSQQMKNRPLMKWRKGFYDDKG